MNDIEILNKKRGSAKSFLNNTPSNISETIIWVKQRTNVPSNLSEKDKHCFFLERKIYHEENRKRFIMIYVAISKLIQTVPESPETAVCYFMVISELLFCPGFHSHSLINHTDIPQGIRMGRVNFKDFLILQ